MALLKRSIGTQQTISGVNKVVILHLYRRNEAYVYIITIPFQLLVTSLF